LANDAKSVVHGLVECNGAVCKLAGVQGDLVELIAKVVELTIDVWWECLDCFELLEDCVDALNSGVYTDCKNGGTVAGRLVFEVSNRADNTELCQVVDGRA
jgi:hypothetical protein